MSEVKVQQAPQKIPSTLTKTKRTSNDGGFDKLLEFYMNPNLSAASQNAALSQSSAAQKGPPGTVLSWAVANGAQFGTNRKYVKGQKTLDAMPTASVEDTSPPVEPESIASAQATEPFLQVIELSTKGNSQASMILAQKQMMEMGQSFNMQYMMIQHMMEKDNRQFTMISNVLKAKSDSKASVIKNIA